MLAAAYLHDLVEDTIATHGLILREFGPVVFSYVYFLTDISRPDDGNRRVRKEMDRLHNADGPPEAQTIKVADLIDNSRSILENDPKFAAVYMEETRLTIDLLHNADPLLVAEANKIIAPISE